MGGIDAIDYQTKVWCQEWVASFVCQWGPLDPLTFRLLSLLLVTP